MFTMVMIVIGLIEFTLGVIFTIYSKSEKFYNIFWMIYGNNSDKVDKMVEETNKCIGENTALTGSMYVFFASLTYYKNLKNFWLIIAIFLVEIFTYRRTNKGIEKISKESQ